MKKAPTILSPKRMVTEAFTDASAASDRLEQIYERNTSFLRDRFEAYVQGEPLKKRVRATYPFVRITTTTHSRVDFAPVLWLRFWSWRARDINNAA